MKKKIDLLIASVFVVLMLTVSCISDLGNYTYSDINEIKISGINDEYNVNMGIENLKISPQITMTRYEGTIPGDRFSCYWILADGSVLDTLSRNLELDAVLDYPPASYTVYFKMRDNETNILWKQKTVVTVGTPYTKGFMVLGENALTGNVELETISMSGADTLVYGDVLKNSGLPTLKNPIKVLHTGKSTYNPKLWVMTGTGSYHLDLLSMKSNLSMSFGTIRLLPSVTGEEEHVVEQFPHICAYDGKTAYDYYRGYITDKGNLYYTSPLFMGDFYDYPHNCTIKFTDPDAVFYKAAPYAIHYIKSSMSGLVWYDTDNDRFLVDKSAVGDKSTELADKATDPFPWNNKAYDRKLVYAENTFNTDGGSTNGNSFAIMKSTTVGDGYIYKFYASSTPVKRGAYTVPASLAPNFSKASLYAISSLRTIILYVYEGRLYAYNYNPGYEQNVDLSQFIGDDPVTMVRFDTQSQPALDYIYIATHNGVTGGRLRKFAFGKDLDNIVLTPHTYFDFNGLCKIKHISWRAAK